MLLLRRQHETGGDIKAARRDEHVIRPAHDGVVASRARESNAFGDEPLPEARATGVRLYEQQAQLGHAGSCGMSNEG